MTNGEGGPLDQIGKFGQRLQGWIRQLFEWEFLRRALRIVPGSSIWLGVFDRINTVGDWLKAHPVPRGQQLELWVNGVLLGNLPGEDDVAPDVSDLVNDPERFFLDALASIFARDDLRATLEAIGGTIYDTSVAAITGNRPPPSSIGADNARTMIGWVTALGAAPQILSSAVEVGSAGQVDQIGHMIQNVYWNLGLGFLTWQTMAPILQAAILEPLTEDVQRQWRGKRFTRNELQDLFALGRRTREQLTDELQKLGYRDDDIGDVVELAYTKLSRSDVIDLWQLGIFDDIDAATRLRALGYSPDDVALILKKEVREDVKADRAESISILTQAVEEGLLPQVEFIALLQEQGYSLNEINLRIQLINIKAENARRKLSVGQLKKAWENNIILDAEAEHQLMALGYAESEVATILETWKAETAPGFLLLNSTNILESYRYGIIDRRAAADLLGKVGYAPDAAETLIEITESKYPEAFGGSPPRKQKLLSLGAITDLFALGRVDENGVLSWAAQSGYSEEDAQNLLILIKSQTAGTGRALSQSTIENAYASEVFTRSQALAALEQLGFTPDDAETTLTVFEQRNPATFAPETVRSVRQPSTAVLVKSYQGGLIDQTEFFARMQEIGYNRDAAQLVLETSNTKQVKGTKSLTKAEITEAYKKNLFGYEETLSRLQELGYSTDDADLLIREEQKGVQSTDVWTALLNGWIDPQSAIVALLGLGFSQDDVLAALNEFTG